MSTNRAPLAHPVRSFARRCAVILALAWLVALAPASRAGSPPPLGRAAADRLAAEAPGAARNARLAAWARDASLDDLLWVLRRDPAELDGAEPMLVAEAMKRVAPARHELLRRLDARRLLLDARARQRAGRDAPELEALRPRQSVFRVAVLLPDRGDYAAYAALVRAGVEAGLAYGRPHGALPIEPEAHGTGDGDVPLGAAVLDTVSRSCGAIVGELLSVSTAALATGARVIGLPLVSPTATDESIGRIGPAVFQVGPSGLQRGERLARAMLAGGPRKIAILTSTSVAHASFVDAFAAEAESLGATIVRRDAYAPGTADFRVASRGLRTFGAEVLFWDGESREADALVRQLAADGVSIKLCGGPSLAPDQFHSTARTLLEGVTWIADDWQLDAPAQAHLDSLLRARGEKSSPLATRGFLAGRRIAAAVDAGARTSGELAARLRASDATLREHGLLDLAAEGATLPVYVVTRGKSVERAKP